MQSIGDQCYADVRVTSKTPKGMGKCAEMRVTLADLLPLTIFIPKLQSNFELYSGYDCATKIFFIFDMQVYSERNVKNLRVIEFFKNFVYFYVHVVF